MHEIDDVAGMFSAVYRTMKYGAKVFIADPIKRISEENFNKCIKLAEDTGFDISGYPKIKYTRSILLSKSRK